MFPSEESGETKTQQELQNSVTQNTEFIFVKTSKHHTFSLS